jgi:hypothetical protein
VSDVLLLLTTVIYYLGALGDGEVWDGGRRLEARGERVAQARQEELVQEGLRDRKGEGAGL